MSIFGEISRAKQIKLPYDPGNTSYRGVLWVPEHLTGEPLGACKINCNAISSRIIHEGWDCVEMDEWPEELREFVK